MAARLVVTVEYVGNDIGLWCLDCNLSTGARVWFTTTTCGQTTLRSNVFCTECRSRNVQDDT